MKTKKQMSNPAAASFGRFKSSKSTEQLLREIDEETQQAENRRMRLFQKIMNKK